jgi:hypothetical protein
MGQDFESASSKIRSCPGKARCRLPRPLDQLASLAGKRHISTTIWGIADKQWSHEQRYYRGNSSAVTLTLPPTGRLASMTV